ncbi:hypothetical protein [Sporosarcina sp. HYO08]|uniref:hypothetical protein n=1 Tax=Sporosarcina sp. HYO08 TaxID=1759557 RepID=UPI00079C6106|nr:hypothetical protein [Sporosarcina sp. HYO08]KXH79729.1 hypothetical protein AU377_09560 [Sporosarcina sp. HYO08]
MNKEDVISYVKQFYPSTATKDVAKALNLSINQVRTLAKQHKVTKCKTYKQELKQQLVVNRRKWYEDNIPKFEPSHLQEQIIFGSLLGDGYISKGAERSINYYYQEHFGESQRMYREWKLSQLNDLNFKINGNFLHSTSHPYFKKLHSILYPNNTKSLSQSFISQCTHPIFLATLYLDDGSLTISYSYNKQKNTVYCHPSIILYTLNLPPHENHLLADHLNKTFGTNFVVSGHPHGHKSLLKINKEQDVRHLLNVIAPYVKCIPSMEYKTNLETNIKQKTENIYKKYGQSVNIVISSSERNRAYTFEEIELIIKLKTANVTDQAIADQLGRTYWSIVYKIGDLRKKSLL